MLTAAESDDADGVVVDVMKEGSDSDAEEAVAKGRREVSLVEFI